MARWVACLAARRLAAGSESGEILVVMGRGSKLLGLAAVLVLASGVARAENLDAGKSAAALFAASCAGCHSSPRGLAKDRGSGLEGFLQEHYTSGPQSAAALAAYLIANPGSAPRGKQQPAGRAAEGAGKQGEARTERRAPPQTTTMRPDSMIEPVEPRRPAADATKGRTKRQQTKQEAPVTPPANAPEPAAAAPATPAAPAAPPAAPAAASPPTPDQSAFSAPSP
jgi:hypothetical protein